MNKYLINSSHLLLTITTLITVLFVFVTFIIFTPISVSGQTVTLPGMDCTTCSSIKTCSCGKYVKRLKCRSCPDGYSCGGYRDYACPAGSFGRGGECAIDRTVENRFNHCPLCPLSTYQDQTKQTTCKPCLPGYIGTKRGAVSHADGCSRCPEGTVSPGGTEGTSCKVCQAGTRIKNAGECEECEKGHYQPLAGQTLCISAQAGYYVPGTGATKQLPCAAGTTSSVGADKCDPCLRGSWSPAASPTCIDALPGEYVPGDAYTEPLVCGPATYTDSPGSTSCLPCPRGRASNINNVSACAVCSAGRYSDAEGLRECKKCRPGAAMDPNKTGSTSVRDCVQCRAGTYSENDAATVCESCQKGTASNTRGATSRYYCGKCAKNYYSESPASTECTSCPAGTENLIEGADSAALCVQCKSGFWNPTKGGQCRHCAGGTFNTGQGNTAPCQKCDKGQYSPPGSDQCFDCLPGTFCPRDGCNTTCDSCRDVRGYSSAPRAESCQFCPQGYEPNTEATGCQSRTMTTSSSRSYNGTETQHSISDSLPATSSIEGTLSNSSSESLSALTKTRFTPSRNFTKTSSKSSSPAETETQQATPSSSSSKETKSVSQNSPSLSDELSPSKPYVSRTIEDSKSENASHTLSKSASIEVSSSKNTHSLSDPTETIQIYPPYRPLGLSAAEQRFQREAIATTAAFVGLASGPTAMAMSRSLGLLQLVGCPKRSPETNNYWSEDRVPFPASLLPGVGFGDKSSKYHRGGVVAFCGVFIIAFAFGYMNTEVIGRPMGLSSSKANDEDKEEELMKKKKNSDAKKINVKEESKASALARQFPRFLYATIAVVLPLWSPQAGFVFSTFQPDDIVLALLPLVAIFSFVIYMTIKVWKSANDREHGIYFTKSFFMMKSEKGKCNSCVISSARSKSIMTSSIGRFWFVGYYFWSRNRGKDNFEAQKILSSLGSQLQKFRGPMCRTNFIETADPFIHSSDDDDDDDDELLASPRRNNNNSSSNNNDDDSGNSNNDQPKKSKKIRNNRRTLLKDGDPNIVIKSNKSSSTAKVLTDWEEKEPPKIQVIEETNTLAARVAGQYLLISWFLGSSVLFLQGIALAQPATCTHVAFVILFENIISALLVFWIRPFVVPIRNIAAMLMEASVVISSIIIVAVLLTNEENKFNDKELAQVLERKSKIASVVQLMSFVISIIVTVIMVISSVGRQILLKLGNCCAVSHEEMWALRIFNDAEEEELQEQEMNEFHYYSDDNHDDNDNRQTVHLPFSPASFSTRAASTRKKKLEEEQKQREKAKNNNKKNKSVFGKIFSPSARNADQEDDDDDNFVPPIISIQQQRSDEELMETLLVSKDKRRTKETAVTTAPSPSPNKKKTTDAATSKTESSPSSSKRRMRKQHQANEKLLKELEKKERIEI